MMMPHHRWNHLIHGLYPLSQVKNINKTILEILLVQHSYYRSQRDALFLKLIMIKNSTCFGQIYCQSSGVSTLYTQQ